MKRAIALFLALIFVFGLIPVSALAAGAGELTLTVTGGTDPEGGGKHADEASVTVKAGTAATGKQFKNWSVTSGDVTALSGYAENKETFNATVAVGNENKSLALEAMYGDLGQLTIAVTNGTLTSSATPVSENTYVTGNAVTIEAPATPSATTHGLALADGTDYDDYEFDCWEITQGEKANLTGFDTDDRTNAGVTVKVPADGASSISMIARYKKKATHTVTIDTSGVTSAVDDDDDVVTILPVDAAPGSKVYVRVASVSGTEVTTRRVNGVRGSYVTTAGGVPTAIPGGVTTEGVGDDGFTTYSFTMPDGTVTVSLEQEFKVTVSGASVQSQTGMHLNDGAYWAEPGDRIMITLKPDSHGRTIADSTDAAAGKKKGWTFNPGAVGAADNTAITDDGDENLRAVAEFTMPEQSLGITIQYNRELAQNTLSVVNGTIEVTPVGQEKQAATSSATVQEGSTVSVTAVRPETMAGMRFKQWIVEGDAAFQAAITDADRESATFDFEMPEVGGTLTAQYVGTYLLSTDGASGYSIAGGPSGTGDADGVEVFYGDAVTVTTAAAPLRWDYSREVAGAPTSGASVTFTVEAGSGISALDVIAQAGYTVTVTNGTLDGTATTGTYAVGDEVTIIANTPTSGSGFNNWTKTAASTDVVFADANASTTTFVMPAGNVGVTANSAVTIEVRTTSKFNDSNLCATIGVTGQSATGNVAVAAKGKALTARAAETGTYTKGSTVKTVAFRTWEAVDGDDDPVTLDSGIDMTDPVLNFHVPTTLAAGKTLILRAVYSGTYAEVTVTNGSGSGKYFSGDTVTITADTKAGQEFDHWTFSYTDPADETKKLTTDVTSSEYTFTMGTDVGVDAVTAEAIYTALPKLTLQTPRAYGAGTVTMTLDAETVAIGAGQTSVSQYWHKDNEIAISAVPQVTNANGATLDFARWALVSGSAEIGDATSTDTTITMASTDATFVALYGTNMLIYKTAERDSVHLYDNWSYEYKEVGESIQLTAEDPDGTFVGWSVYPSSLAYTLSGTDDRVISFLMPTGTVQVYPLYGHKLTLTDAYYSLDNQATWTLADPSKPISVTAGALVYITPLTGIVAPGTGNRIFSSWVSNSTRISSQYSTATVGFWMPPEDVEAYVNYKKYKLTVYRTVDGTPETYALMPGEYITLSSEDASGGRCFNYWTHTAGLTFTVNDENWDSFDKSLPDAKQRLVSQRITVQMPASDAYIQAHYSMYPSQEYWNTDASIRVEGEPKRYYALLEYFQPYDMKVIYYAGALSTGVEVDPSDYEILIVKAGTYEVATTADKCFTQEGEFDLLITMRVNGVQMAPTIRVMNEASTHLYCTAMRPEFVRTYTKPSRTVYYEGEEVSKDGMDVDLLSVYHVSGTMRYSVARELNESEYKLKPWGTGWDVDGKTNTKLPTQEEIAAKAAKNEFGYKVEGNRHYVCMEITDCFDYTQFNSDGSYMRMEYIVNDLKDYIWVEVKEPIENISIEALKGNNTSDVVLNQAGAVYPFVSWEITESLATAMDKGRTLVINADNYQSKDDIANAIEIINSDSDVAYLMPTADKLTWKVIVKSPGVTTITVRARGTAGTANEVKATCEITVHSNTALKDMVTLAPNGLNHTALNMYVGTKQSLYPVTYTPVDAVKTCNWVVTFSDGLEPQNAEYYVSVSEAGVVEVLKYTDRPVRIYALPSTPVGQNTLEKAKNNYPNEDTGTPKSLYAYCNITVLQIPVDNMTLYPTGITLYRLASKSLKATLYPEAASDKTIRWTSSDSSVASVVDGVVTANKLGTATITATSESNPSVYQTCTVTVAQSVLLTGLTLNKTNATLGIEDTMVLTPYYTPATATTKSVTWESNASSVATVDANGKVRGISEGVAVITATANDGSGKHVSCVVSVSTIVSSAVVLNKQTLALIEDETETLVATVYPTNVSNSKVNWSSSNEKVATVDPDGVVTATGGGSAVITATARDASTKYADCVVAVTAKIPVTNITLNLGNFDMLLNDTTVLTPTIAPANATYKITWTSSNETVAKVDEKGKVSALATGDAVITCKAGDRTAAITVSIVTKTFSTGKVVNCARRVNVRANSSGGSTIVGYAYLGDVYRVLDKSGNWYKIQYNATTTAYIWHRYLSATETSAGYVSAGKVGSTTTDTTGTGTATPAPVVTAKSLTITNCTYCVNVRSGAGTNFSRLGYAYLDESFTYTGVTGDWYIITYNGATAYVSSQFVKVNG